MLEDILMTCRKDGNKVDVDFQVSRRLLLNSEAGISSLHWLSSNILFAKVGRRSYYLLDTTRFQTQEG